MQTLFYARHKAAAERALDAIEAANPGMTVVRLRPGLIFKREAGPEIRRLFAGPLLPAPLVRRRLPLLPLPDRLVLQCVHGEDIGEAYRLAALSRGVRRLQHRRRPDPHAASARARPGLPAACACPRSPCASSPTSASARTCSPRRAGWVDMGLQVPVMDTSRAREQLGWTPRHDAPEALRELLAGMREPAGLDTPPLEPRAGGPLRVRELLSGLGHSRHGFKTTLKAPSSLAWKISYPCGAWSSGRWWVA